MFHSLIRITALFAMLAIPLRSSNAAPSIVGVGELTGGGNQSWVYGISGDGSVVVGSSESNVGREAFRWTRDRGIEGLGVAVPGDNFSAAGAVNYDGSVVVGSSVRVSGDYTAFRWTAATGMISIGDLPGGLTQGYATGVSADGSVVVGTGTRSPTGGIEPFIWTESSGVVPLDALPPGATSGYAVEISADGTVVAGGISGFGIQGTRWTASTGIVPLGDLASDQPPPGTSVSGMSADGRTLVGYSTANGSLGAVAWIEGRGWIPLAGASRFHTTFAYDVDANGSTIVGEDFTNEPGGEVQSRATIWTERDGTRLLQDVLTNVYGIDLTGWRLFSATAISDDGLTIVGNGLNPSGIAEGWVAVIPEPSTALLLTLGMLVLSGRRSPGPRPGFDRSV